MRNWLINKLLAHDGLVAVPTTWQKEFVQLASYKVQHKESFKIISDEYNSLLKDFFEALSAKKLYDYLKTREVENLDENMTKEELVTLGLDNFSMFYTEEQRECE